jgi:sugar phosphate isomerase/epimerase
MILSRREWLARAALFPAAAALPRAPRAGPAGIRIGSCVVDLEGAKAAGVEGVEIRAALAGDDLDLADPAVRRRYRERRDAAGVSIPSIMLGLLNEHPLATDPRGPSWLAEAIDASNEVGAGVILVAFFGDGDLLGPGGRLKSAERAEVVRRLKAAAPRAEATGVILAVENYLDAAQNLALLDEVNSPAVRLYYDCYNTGITRGYDVPGEIRRLGDRIAQYHFKNGDAFLDAAEAHYRPIGRAIREGGHRGWVVLETSSPTGDPLADSRRNAEFARSLLR